MFYNKIEMRYRNKIQNNNNQEKAVHWRTFYYKIDPTGEHQRFSNISNDGGEHDDNFLFITELTDSRFSIWKKNRFLFWNSSAIGFKDLVHGQTKICIKVKNKKEKKFYIEAEKYLDWKKEGVTNDNINNDSDKPSIYTLQIKRLVSEDGKFNRFVTNDGYIKMEYSPAKKNEELTRKIKVFLYKKNRC